jgi:hypothetical protein
LTKEREQPFSFYERDKAKHIERFNAEEEKEVKQFKAKAMPKVVQVQEDKEEKKEKRKAHAEALMAESKLPPRMEQAHINSTKKTSKNLEEQYTFKPAATKPLPDFKKQQEEFEMQLEKHKKQRPTTVPQPFEFTEPIVGFGDKAIEEGIE